MRQNRQHTPQIQGLVAFSNQPSMTLCAFDATGEEGSVGVRSSSPRHMTVLYPTCTTNSLLLLCFFLRPEEQQQYKEAQGCVCVTFASCMQCVRGGCFGKEKSSTNAFRVCAR